MMGGILIELYLTLDPEVQATIAALSSLSAFTAAGLVGWYLLSVDSAADDATTEAEFAPTLARVRALARSVGHDPYRQMRRRSGGWDRVDRQKPAGRHRQDNEPATPGPDLLTPEEAVDRAFADVHPAGPVSADPMAASVTARGMATVQQDLEAFLAAVSGVCAPTPPPAVANTEQTTLLPAVTADAEPAR